MKTLCIVLALALVAAVSAEERVRRFRRDVAGLTAVPGGLAAPFRNDFRQQYVNAVAESTGASSGTARKYGVPGAGGYYYNYPPYYYGGYYRYGHPGYGYPFAY